MSEELKQAIRVNLMVLLSCSYTLSKSLDSFIKLLNENGLINEINLVNEINIELFKINKTLSDSKN